MSGKIRFVPSHVGTQGTLSDARTPYGVGKGGLWVVQGDPRRTRCWDVGRTVTPKTCRIYHARLPHVYLRSFHHVLMFAYYPIPEKATHRITGTSPALVKGYVELAKKHFPNPDAIRNYLVSRGVKG